MSEMGKNIARFCNCLVLIAREIFEQVFEIGTLLNSSPINFLLEKRVCAPILPMKDRKVLIGC
jgi:hypothetical protein